jgi:hypothetical protein
MGPVGRTLIVKKNFKQRFHCRRCLRFPLPGLSWLGLVSISLLLLAAAANATPFLEEVDGALTTRILWRKRLLQAAEFRFWIASAAAVLLAVRWGLARMGREAILARLRDALLVLLSLATLLAWWYPHQGTFETWIHRHDMFNYYMGAKYFDELGYTRLYHCAAVADAEEGLAWLVANTEIRNLKTNKFESGRLALENTADCKRHFSPELWQSFKEDLSWFRSDVSSRRWITARHDHGYNPPPTWTMIGSLLTGTGPVNSSQILALTLIDPVLLVGMFVALAWAFGWRTMCVALIFWGTNQPASWMWVGGSILRYDWLVTTVVGICCLKRQRPVAAGLFLAWAVGIRIFPAVIVVGLVLTAALRLLQTRSFVCTVSQRRFAWAFASGIVGILLLTSLSVGPKSWADFAGNSQLHMDSDTANRIGLRPLLAFRADALLEDFEGANKMARWKKVRKETLEPRRPLLYLIVAAYLVLLVFAVRRQPDWIAAVLGVGIIPVMSELGCYYYGVLLIFACLWPLREEIGVALLVVASVSCWGAQNPNSETLTAQTAFAILLLVAFATIRMLSYGKARSDPGISSPSTP